MPDRCSAACTRRSLLACRSARCGDDANAVPIVVSAPVSTEPWIASLDRERAPGSRSTRSTPTAGLDLEGGKRRPLKLVVLDNASSPATALANAREAVERNAAMLLTDGTGAIAIGDITDRAHCRRSSSSRAARS